MILVVLEHTTSKEEDSVNININMGYHGEEEQELIAECFVREFYDPVVQRWTTVSKSQGGGGVRRRSASAASQTLGLPEDAEDTPYYRAVDQAIAVLACLEQIKVLDTKKIQTKSQTQTQTDAIDIIANQQRATMVDLVRTTCADLLSPAGGFGYGGDEITNAKSYLGLDRNRNFWHDGWTFLALLKARDYAWPASASDSDSDTDRTATQHGSNGEAQLQSMWKGLEEMYGCSDSNGIATGTIWHWPKELKGGDDDGDASTTTNNNNVRYCGDNALAHAIRRNLDRTEAKEDGFWNFIAGLTIGHEAGLSSVADVYPQVRLHPNTELSALLVWP